MAAKAVNTIGTVLKFGEGTTEPTKMCPITSYPDLFGEPEMIDVTDLDDESQTNIPGIIQMDNMQFEANYLADTFKTLKDGERKEGKFILEFGEGGKDGIFTWEGQYTVGLTGQGNNAARTMTINSVASSEIEFSLPAGA